MSIFKKLQHHKLTADKSTSVQSSVEPSGDELFDNLSRSMAGSLTRREALKVAFTGLAGMVLMKIGINTAWAGTECLCNGAIPYDPKVSCCTLSGVVQKNPIADLNNCPGKVPNPTYKCNPNGCGGEGGTPVPNGFMGANFYPACAEHDCCYGECNHYKNDCDTNFRANLNLACSAAAIMTVNPNLLAACKAVALLYYGFVSKKGQTYYDAAQKQACSCCGDETCTGCVTIDPRHPSMLCTGIRDLAVTCCTHPGSCYSTGSHAKCCPQYWVGFSDEARNVHCCPPKTVGSNVGGFFRCE